MMSEEQRRKNSPNSMNLVINKMCKFSNLAKLVISHGAQDPDTLYFILRELAEQSKRPREHPGGVASHVQGVIASKRKRSSR